MSNNNFSGSGDAQFNNKPPYFDGKYYNVWCNKMKWFFKASDNLMWDVVTKGVNPTPSSTSDDETPTATVSKTEKAKREGLDSKAAYSLFCALYTLIYNRVAK